MNCGGNRDNVAVDIGGRPNACFVLLGDALKRKLKLSGRFALSSVAAAALCLASPLASALGLGRLNVQSSLGEVLRAEIEPRDARDKSVGTYNDVVADRRPELYDPTPRPTPRR